VGVDERDSDLVGLDYHWTRFGRTGFGWTGFAVSKIWTGLDLEVLELQDRTLYSLNKVKRRSGLERDHPQGDLVMTDGETGFVSGVMELPSLSLGIGAGISEARVPVIIGQSKLILIYRSSHQQNPPPGPQPPLEKPPVPRRGSPISACSSQSASPVSFGRKQILYGRLEDMIIPIIHISNRRREMPEPKVREIATNPPGGRPMREGGQYEDNLAGGG
jgi:hypothetical protein